ncbi:hypothetical protein BDQ17DRAFT_1335098 [Cyathus striatus]|nr:hypothetical protein BDQ17DRAFT_1335098 [Cyathus striatus]
MFTLMACGRVYTHHDGVERARNEGDILVLFRRGHGRKTLALIARKTRARPGKGRGGKEVEVEGDVASTSEVTRAGGRERLREKKREGDDEVGFPSDVCNVSIGKREWQRASKTDTYAVVDKRKAVCVVRGGIEWLEAGMLPSSQSLLRNMPRVVEPTFIAYNLQATFYETHIWRMLEDCRIDTHRIYGTLERMLEGCRISTHRTMQEAQVKEHKERQGLPNQSERGKTSRSYRIVNWYNISSNNLSSSFGIHQQDIFIQFPTRHVEIYKGVVEIGADMAMGSYKESSSVPQIKEKVEIRLRFVFLFVFLTSNFVNSWKKSRITFHGYIIQQEAE